MSGLARALALPKEQGVPVKERPEAVQSKGTTTPALNQFFFLELGLVPLLASLLWGTVTFTVAVELLPEASVH
jgi:hypothetical protein